MGNRQVGTFRSSRARGATVAMPARPRPGAGQPQRLQRPQRQQRQQRPQGVRSGPGPCGGRAYRGHGSRCALVLLLVPCVYGPGMLTYICAPTV